jgi:DNA repair protein RadC
MNDDLLSEPKLAGAQSTVEIISNLLMTQGQLQSGIIGVNDKLKMVFIETFQCALDKIAIEVVLEFAVQKNVTGVVTFEVFPNNQLCMNRRFINKLLASCEVVKIVLLDVILYSKQDWASLRQQNII